jgi:hypothetical protein
VRHQRHFTLDEARAELTWAAGRLAALRDARERLTDTEAREELAEGAPGNGGGQPGRQGGIVLRDLDRGLIDFPAIRDGREVYLCWVEGEPDIGYWHELDAGYAGRQKL